MRNLIFKSKNLLKLIILLSIFAMISIGCGGGGGDEGGVAPAGGGGGGGDTSNVPSLSPAEVVEQAMKAQVEGDIDGFLSICAFKGASDEQVADNEKLLNTVKDNISLSEYSFEPLATGIYRDETVAIVRAITSYTINNEFEEKDGILCYLKKEDNQWKLVRLFPDPFLNQEIFESSLESDTNANSTPSLKSQGTSKSSGEPYSLKELNDKFNRMLENSFIDNDQVIWDSTFSGMGVAGKMLSGPAGYGLSAVATLETIAGLSKNFGELAYIYGYDKSPRLKSMKWTQISVGIAQIVIDVSPNKNAIPLAIEADALAAGLNQVEYNMKLKKYIRRLQAALMDPELVIENPYLVAYEQKAYGTGIEVFSDSATLDPSLTYLYPYVIKIKITEPSAIGKDLPFKVVGQIEFPSQDDAVQKALLELGGKTLPNGNVYIALDITSMAQSVVQTLTPNLIINSDNNGLKSGNIGTVTCSNSQTEQPFSILLSNGDKTQEVKMETFMKELYLLSNFEMGWKEYGIALYKGGNRDIHIYGVFGSLPDIKELPAECFDITTGDDIIASVSVYDNINLQGLENGDTWMEVSLKNDKNFAGASFPVKVAESCPMMYNSAFDIGEDHVITFGIEDKNKDGFFDDFLDCRYWESGHLSRSTPAIDGKLQGIETTYYESGEVYAEYPFKMGKVEGLAKVYYESGQLYYSVPYVNDTEEGDYKEYYESGQLYYSVPYVNGVREREYRDYYESGQLYRKIPYVNDIQEGTVYGYYESGQLNFEIPYVNGQKNGTETYYYTNGDYSLYPWVNGQINGNSPSYTKESNGYVMTSCDIYVNDVITGSCMPPK